MSSFLICKEHPSSTCDCAIGRISELEVQLEEETRKRREADTRFALVQSRLMPSVGFGQQEIAESALKKQLDAVTRQRDKLKLMLDKATPAWAIVSQIDGQVLLHTIRPRLAKVKELFGGAGDVEMVRVVLFEGLEDR